MSIARHIAIGCVALLAIATAAQAGPVPLDTTSCPAGQTNCSGTCRDTQHDSTNCGSCGTPCAAGSVCTSGTCAVSCQAGMTNCRGACTNTSFDPRNCGSCANVCNLSHASAVACVSSVCEVVTCAAGFGNCDGAPANGCESTLATDAANCGGCGRACPHGCAAGRCML
jgi:hypothetical protein